MHKDVGLAAAKERERGINFSRVVLAITKSNVDARPTLFKTYDTSAALDYCSIWEVARATSAATTFFKPIQVGRDAITFIDAGFGYNNPCEELIQEAQRVFPRRGELQVLSIGTGLGDVVDISKTRIDIIKALEKIATSSKKVASRLEDRFRESDQYFRFNVDRGLEDITLSDWKQASTIAAHTANYLSENTRKIEKFIMVFTRDVSPSIKDSEATNDRKRLQQIRENESDAVNREGSYQTERNTNSSTHLSHSVDGFSSENPPVPSPSDSQFLDGLFTGSLRDSCLSQRLQVPDVNDEHEIFEAAIDDMHQNAHSWNASRDPRQRLPNRINYRCLMCNTKMHHTEKCPWFGKDHLRCHTCEFIPSIDSTEYIQLTKPTRPPIRTLFN